MAILWLQAARHAEKYLNTHLKSLCRSADTRKFYFYKIAPHWFRQCVCAQWALMFPVLSSEDNNSVKTAFFTINNMKVCVCVCVQVCLLKSFHHPHRFLMQSVRQLSGNFPLFSPSRTTFSPSAHLPGDTKPIYYDCITINDFITSACQ